MAAHDKGRNGLTSRGTAEYQWLVLAERGTSSADCYQPPAAPPIHCWRTQVSPIPPRGPLRWPFPPILRSAKNPWCARARRQLLCVKTRRKTLCPDYSNFILSRLGQLSGCCSGQARGSEDRLVSNKSVSLPATSTWRSKFRSGLGFPANERPKTALETRPPLSHAIITTPSTHTHPTNRFFSLREGSAEQFSSRWLVDANVLISAIVWPGVIASPSPELGFHPGYHPQLRLTGGGRMGLKLTKDSLSLDHSQGKQSVSPPRSPVGGRASAGAAPVPPAVPRGDPQE